MRTIKFRAWNEELNQMSYDIDTNFGYDNRAKVKLTQFTGIKDLDGNDIYEGDIVEHEDGSGRGEVIFGDGSFFTRLYDWKMIYLGHDLTRFKVIGNIYENKDLLK